MLFSTTARAGHFGPMIPIAHACADAGHSVAVAAPASFEGSVANAGLAHLPFPDVPADDIRAVYSRLPSLPREDANRVAVTQVFGRFNAQAALSELLTLIPEWGPDGVIRDPTEFGTLVAAARFGLPQVQVAIDLGGFVPTVADWLNELIRELERMTGSRVLVVHNGSAGRRPFRRCPRRSTIAWRLAAVRG